MLAPAGCLQYFTAASGTVTSFNYDGVNAYSPNQAGFHTKVYTSHKLLSGGRKHCNIIKMGPRKISFDIIVFIGRSATIWGPFKSGQNI